MGQWIQNKSEAIYSIEEYAGLVLLLAQNLLQAGSAIAAGGKAGRKFDVSSLSYERAKNDLLDSFVLIRAADFRDIPFFLSHQALRNVEQRLSGQGKCSKRAKDLLIRANHQVFICNVEDVIDNASHNSFDAAQSKRGYAADRVDIVLKLKSIIAEYESSQKSLGGSLPKTMAKSQSAQMTQSVREQREKEANRQAVKLAGMTLQKSYALFDPSILSERLSALKNSGETVYLIVQDGQIFWHQDRMRWNVRAQKSSIPQGRNPDTVILRKFFVHEVADLLGTSAELLRVRIEGGLWHLDRVDAQPAQAGKVAIVTHQITRPRTVILSGW